MRSEVVSQEQKVKQYMRTILATYPNDFIDCNEVNATALGEWAIDEYKLDAGDNADAWTWAFDISQEYRG